MALSKEDREEMESVLSSAVHKGMAAFRSQVDEEDAKRAEEDAKNKPPVPPTPPAEHIFDVPGYLLGRRK